MGGAGGKWTHEWTYQGFVAQGGKFRRSPGLEPEGGYVDLPYESLGKLDIPNGPVWFDSGMGPKDIRTFFSGGGSRAANQKTIGNAGSGGGLGAFGDLVMTSTFNEAALPPMIYSGIFVSSEGTEELTLGLSEQQSHSLGLVRVQLTDIRSTYKHGAFLGKINCRMRTTGKWIKNTTKDGKGTPWSAREVFIFLFSELTGSPGLHPASVIFHKNFAPPYDLVGEGEPAVEHVAKLLKHYGLTAYLLPDCSYLVGYELDVEWGQGEFAAEAGSAATIPVEYLAEERKCVSQAVTRTAACLGVGSMRRLASTLPWIPVIQNPKSGRIYPQTDEMCLKHGGLSLEEVNFEVLRDPSKNFRNCEPVKKREGFLRGRMFREWAYRVYAPAIAFDPDKKGDGGLDPEEFACLPFMPMHEAPWKKEDLKKHGLEVIKRKKGDVGKPGEWVLHPPIVFAAGLKQGFFADFKAIEDYFKVALESFKDEKKRLGQLLEQLKSRAGDLDSSILEADKTLKKKFNSGYAKSKFGLSVAPLVSPGADNNAGRDLGSTIDAIQHAKSSATHGHSTKEYKDAIAAALKILDDAEYAVGQETAAREAKANFEKFKEVYRRYGGIQAWANFPHGPIPEKEYNLDEETGLLTFSRPMVRTKLPFLIQTEGAEVIADGGVMVTFGFEYNFNLLADYTSVLFVAQDQMNGEGATTGRAVVAGLNRGSAVKPVVVRDPNIRLYENEHGVPYNTTEVVSAAVPRAAGQLEVPLNAVGYTYVLQGLHKASLDEGVSSVQHEFDGDVARTYVSINSPGARGLPLGKPKLNFYTEDGRAIARDQISAAQPTEGR